MLFNMFLIISIIFTLFFFYTDVMNKIITNKPFAEGYENTNYKKDPPDATSCNGWDCSIEGQLCPKGVSGASSGNYVCKDKKWVRDDSKASPSTESAESTESETSCVNGFVKDDNGMAVCNKFTGCYDKASCQKIYPGVIMNNWTMNQNGKMETSNGYEESGVGCANYMKRGCDRGSYSPDPSTITSQESPDVTQTPPPTETSLDNASNSSTGNLQQDTSIPQVQTQEEQISQTPAYQQAINQIGGNTNYQMANGNLLSSPTGNCPNGCKAPQYDNEKCSNEIIGGKAYRNCPWIGEGSINDSMCKDCGSVLLPKNIHGYARTRPGLFNNNTVNNLLDGKNFNKEPNNPNINYKNIGFDFMNELSMARNFTLPNISQGDLVSIGKVVNKYQLDEPTGISDKKELVDIINDVLNTGKLPNTLNSNKNEFDLQNTADNTTNDKDKNRSERIIKGLIGSGKYYNASAKAKKERNSDNRLGGSSMLYDKMAKVNNSNAYTTKYRPVDPRKKPKPYDSIWELFSQ